VNYEQEPKDQLKEFDWMLISVWILSLTGIVLRMALGWRLCRMYGR
jgi:hypothetical protein